MTTAELGAQPAFPVEPINYDDVEVHRANGLTKLELFTLGAMAGLLARGDILIEMLKQTNGDQEKAYGGVAHIAVGLASAQLDALAKGATP